MITSCAFQEHATEFDGRFKELFDALARFARSRGVHGYWAIGGNCKAEDAEDFAQECLLEYLNRARSNGFRSVDATIVKRIAHSRLVDTWRKKRRRAFRRRDFEDFGGQLSVCRNSADDRQSTRKLDFSELSAKSYEILWLKHVAGWLDREIAEWFGMTVEGIRSSLKRSRRILDKRATVGTDGAV